MKIKLISWTMCSIHLHLIYNCFVYGSQMYVQKEKSGNSIKITPFLNYMIQFISSTSWLNDCVGHFKWKFMSKSSMFNYFPCCLKMVTVHSYEVQIKPDLEYQQRSLVADRIFDFQVSWSLAAHLSTCLKETFILILSPFIDKLYVVITS